MASAYPIHVSSRHLYRWMETLRMMNHKQEVGDWEATLKTAKQVKE